MPDLTTIDAARADEIVALAIPALTAELAGLDKDSLELVLKAETAKGDSARTGALDAINAAIAALEPPAPPVVETPSVVAEEPVEQPVEEPVYDGGLVLMHNDDLTGCSWRGVSYEIDADGAVHVPPEAVSDLTSHGFRYVTKKVG